MIKAITPRFCGSAMQWEGWETSSESCEMVLMRGPIG